MLTVPERKSWHTKEEVRKQLLKYYEEFAEIPKDKLTKAKDQHKIYIQQFESELKKIGWCKKLEYTGSVYEGLKISLDVLEFDVMFLLDGKGLKCTPLQEHDGYCNISICGDIEGSKISQFNEDGILLSEQMIEKFLGDVQLIVNKLTYGKKIKLRKHGPAVQMDVKDENGKDWYCVDLVPALDINVDGESVRFVPKPLTDPENGEPLKHSWRRSFSKEEKEILKNLDEGNGCRRQVVRILKAICKKESTLQRINSYHLKTTLFHVIGPNGLQLAWSNGDVAERVLDMLGVLEIYLERKNLPQYFVPSMNLLSNISLKHLENMKSRIFSIRNDEKKFMKVLDF